MVSVSPKCQKPISGQVAHPCSLVTDHLVLVSIMALLLAGCLTNPMNGETDPCTEPALAGDGTLVQPDQPYWTLVADKIPIPDGQSRVDGIPAITIKHNGEEVPSITRGAYIDGQPWIDRWWGCRLGSLEYLRVTEGSEFFLVADSNEADPITVSFTFHHAGGADIGYAPDPVWKSNGHELSARLGKINEGKHSVYVGVFHPDGSSRTHLFRVHYE